MASSEGSTESLPRGHDMNEDMFDSYLSGEEFPILEDKVVAITGTTTGLGYHLARLAITKNVGSLLLLNRQSDRSDKAHADLKSLVNDGSKTDIVAIQCDLQSLDSVRKAAGEVNSIASDKGGLDVLCNNAGIMAMPDKRTKDGFDIQMQTNQLSHFLLISLVFKSLEEAATSRGESRVVTQSSSARFGPPLDGRFFVKSKEGTLGGDSSWFISQKMGIKDGPWSRYHQTKLANSAFAMELHNRLKAASSKVKSIGCEPGYSVTPLQSSAGFFSGWMDMGLIPKQSAADGCLNAAMGCFSPTANSGDMFVPEKGFVGKPVLTIKGGIPVKEGGEKETCDPKNQSTVFEACEKALGIKFGI